MKGPDLKKAKYLRVHYFRKCKPEGTIALYLTEELRECKKWKDNRIKINIQDMYDRAVSTLGIYNPPEKRGQEHH